MEWPCFRSYHKRISQPLLDCLLIHLLKQPVDMAKSVHSNVVHFIMDTYHQLDINSGERGWRATAGSQLTEINVEDQKVPQQWKKFLSCNVIKAALKRFVFKTWSHHPAHILRDVCVIMTQDGKCHWLCEVEVAVEFKSLKWTGTQQWRGRNKTFSTTSLPPFLLPALKTEVLPPLS